MRAPPVVDTLTCARCGRTVARPTRRPHHVSRAAWAKRQYCSRACAGFREVREGDRYGRWTVVEFAEWSTTQETRWRCRCDCGGEKVVTAHFLTSGTSRSCGCYRREVARTLCLRRDHPRWLAHQAKGVPKALREAWGLAATPARMSVPGQDRPQDARGCPRTGDRSLNRVRARVGVRSLTQAPAED